MEKTQRLILMISDILQSTDKEILIKLSTQALKEATIDPQITIIILTSLVALAKKFKISIELDDRNQIHISVLFNLIISCSDIKDVFKNIIYVFYASLDNNLNLMIIYNSLEVYILLKEKTHYCEYILKNSININHLIFKIIRAKTRKKALIAATAAFSVAACDENKTKIISGILDVFARQFNHYCDIYNYNDNSIYQVKIISKIYNDIMDAQNNIETIKRIIGAFYISAKNNNYAFTIYILLKTGNIIDENPKGPICIPENLPIIYNSDSASCSVPTHVSDASDNASDSDSYTYEKNDFTKIYYSDDENSENEDN